MDEVVGQVHEIADKKLIAYAGNYTDYLRQREERYEQQLAAHKNQQKEIQALQQFATGFAPSLPKPRKRWPSSNKSSA